MTTARQKVHTLAKELGTEIKIDTTGDYFEVEVEAPYGYVWTYHRDVHCLVASEHSGPWSKASLWRDLLERMTSGLELCEIADCEWCEDGKTLRPRDDCQKAGCSQDGSGACQAIDFREIQEESV